MAIGDVVFFNQFNADALEGVHNLDGNTLRLGLITDTVTPTASTADPRWGSGGSTNLATNQVTPGGNYSTGGPTITNNSVALVGGSGVFDADDVTISQNASNPTNARWGIIYNDTDAGKRAVGFVDLGSVINLSTGQFSITWNASGIATLSHA